MSELEARLKRIQEKLQLLLKDQSALQKENERLKKELAKSREHSSNQKKLIDNLQQQIEVLKLNSGEMKEADKKEIEKRINSYIKDIEQCITILGE